MKGVKTLKKQATSDPGKEKKMQKEPKNKKGVNMRLVKKMGPSS